MIDTIHAFTPDDGAIGKSGLFGDSPPVRAATSLLSFDFGPAIAELSAPTLILWGKEDDVVPPRIAHLLKDRITPSELVFIDGGGHAIVRDQPKSVAEHAVEFLDRRTIDPEKLRAPNVSARVGRCDGQKDVILEGDFARIEVHNCRHIWIDHARARSIEIVDSEGRIDNSEVSDGVVVKTSQLSVTGGTLRGRRAIQLTDSKLDIAGVAIEGSEAAVYALSDVELVFSVSALKSPLNERTYHEEVSLAADHAL